MPLRAVFAPVAVSALGDRAQAIASGWFHSCASRGACGEVLGLEPFGSYRAVGADCAVDEVIGLDSPAQFLVSGGVHSCALLEDGAVKCWVTTNGSGLCA